MPELGGQKFSYPQAPQPNQGLFGDPSKLIDTLGGLQRLQILGQQAPALGQIPGQELTNLKTQQVNAQMQQQADVLQRARAAYGAEFGSRDNIDPREVDNFTTNYVRANPVDGQYFPGIINSVASGLVNNPVSGMADPKGISQRARELQSLALPPGQAGGITGTIGAGGQPIGITGAAAVQRGTIPLGQPVGEEIGQQASAKSAADLENAGPQSAQYHANLENLKQDSAVLGQLGGPSTVWERPLNALAQRLGAKFGITMSPDQLQAADSFDKIVNQISLGQGAVFANAGATDASRSMTLHANPNTQMTQKSREALIDMLQGNQDAQDKLREVWATARNPMDKNGRPIVDPRTGQQVPPMARNQFNDFVREFTMSPLNSKGARFDPRVFQFGRMDKPAQQQFLNTMSPQEARQFETNAEEAQARGWVNINAAK